jgi:hypothetical protein
MLIFLRIFDNNQNPLLSGTITLPIPCATIVHS